MACYCNNGILILLRKDKDFVLARNSTNYLKVCLNVLTHKPFNKAPLTKKFVKVIPNTKMASTY